MPGHRHPDRPVGVPGGRHRGHAPVEDRIRNAKQTGLGRFPSREFAINAVWLQLALTAADLLAWTQTILLDGATAKAEPKLLVFIGYQLYRIALQPTACLIALTVFDVVIVALTWREYTRQRTARESTDTADPAPTISNRAED